MCTCHGSLPALRTGTKPAPRRTATGAAMMKPRASTPMTLSMARSAKASASAVTHQDRAGPLASSGVMSLKTTPGCGKSGMSLISSFSQAG